MFNLFNFILFLTILIVYSTSFSEARLGKGGQQQEAQPQEEGLRRQLSPSAVVEPSSSSSLQNHQVQQQDMNGVPPPPKTDNTNKEGEDEDDQSCNSMCSDGNRVKVCHKRGDYYVEICTEQESFVDHKKMWGDVCGPCPVW